jgi:uncharacterized RDD family membrane protein YckC
MNEFDEIQKFWNEQKGEAMYAVNESALYSLVSDKKEAAGKRISRVEIMISIINGTVGIFLAVLAVIHPHIINFIDAGIMAITVVYIQYFRRKRKKAENTFDRSLLGELDHAISHVNAIIRFNYLMLVGYLIPLLVLCISALITAGASWEKWLLVSAAFVLSILVLRWEQGAYNVPRKNQLLALRKKLMVAE